HRAVVAEIAKLAVEAGAEEATNIIFVFLGVLEDAGAFGNDKRVGKSGAETGELVFVVFASGFVFGRSECGNGIRVFDEFGVVEREAASAVLASVGRHFTVFPKDQRLRSWIGAGHAQVADINFDPGAEIDNEP